MNYQITDLFNNILESINSILSSNIYITKDNIPKIKEIIEEWYNEYSTKKTLKTVAVKDLEFIEEEVVEYFDKYVMNESSKNNYAERLLFYWGILLHKWKNEMLGKYPIQ